MAHRTDDPQADLALIRALIHRVTDRLPLHSAPAAAHIRDTTAPGPALYTNRNERLGIDLMVERVAFPQLQTLDPRIVRIAPSCASERHRHAHETLFVVLSGHGDVLVGDQWLPLKCGDIAFVPRWVFHQTRNGSTSEPLVVLAVTDFGFTSALVGADDRSTRLATDGADALAEPAR